MRICCDGAMAMPSSYAVMDETEMTYIEGGGMQYITGMRNKFVCKNIAQGISGNYNKIGVTDIAAEIYTHALLHYNGALFMLIAAKAGIKKAASMFKSVENGIDIENGLDKRKVNGVYFYQIYRTMYCMGPTVF